MSKAYEDRTDLEKIQSQWKKLTGLHTREEWSAAVVRAATACELAANFAIRKEFEAQSDLDSQFVDSLLRWANGLAGKMTHLLLPLSKGAKLKTVKKLKSDADEINKERNAVVHQGEFRNDDDAKETIGRARLFIETLIQVYEPRFRLQDHPKAKA